MHRHLTTVFLAFIALGLVFASPALAGDSQRIEELEKRVEALSAQQSTQMEKDIEGYLDDSSSWKAADGDGMKNITITAAFTGNSAGTLDVDPNDRFVVSGDVDLGFHFKVTENLSLHITATAAAGGSSSSTANLNPTFSGLSDGVGTNGNASTTGTGRALNVYEAYISHAAGMLNWEAGAIDPRTRFLQNAYADDENTQFINNLFDDSASVLWQTGASGAGVLGVHVWASFGGDNKDMVTVSLGWFGAAGTSFINNSSLFLQVAFHLNVGKGGGMNVRLMLNYDDINRDASNDPTIAWGLSWDWELADKIGVFIRIAGNDDDPARGNPVEMDITFGGQFTMGDQGHVIGLAIGFVSANTGVGGAGPDDEITVEVYFRMNMEDGKLQITPFIMYVTDPAGGGDPANDTLFVIGLRIHVPF